MLFCGCAFLFLNYTPQSSDICNDLTLFTKAQAMDSLTGSVGASGRGANGSQLTQQKSLTAANAAAGSCGLTDLGCHLKWMFFGIVILFAKLIVFFVALIEWTLSETFMDLLRNDGLYTGWQMVRDVLNILFIFFLIFSAFATIFQVSKYHIRSTWVMIVVMALLVNFSWPITRVIIDISNITMYHIMGNSSGDDATSGITDKIGDSTQFAYAALGVNNAAQYSSAFSGGNAKGYTEIFMAIITSFLFMITMAAIAGILVIRVIALAVLLVFASIGFTMAAFPTTRSYSSQWWSALIKYCFTGPILLFMLLLSITVMANLGSDFTAGAQEAAENNIANPNDKSVITVLLEYVVSLFILWSGIIMAGKIGGAGSSFIVGKANAAAKWGGNRLKRGTIGGGKFVGRRADMAAGRASSTIGSGIERVTKGKTRLGFSGRAPSSYVQNTKQRIKNVQDAEKKRYNKYVEESSAVGLAVRWRGKFGGDKNAVADMENKKRLDMKKKWKDDDVDAGTLAGKLDNAGAVEARAISEALTEMKEGVDDAVIQKMIDNSSKITNENTLKAISKKAAETGNSHISFNANLQKKIEDHTRVNGAGPSAVQLNSLRKQATNEVYGNMDGKTYAKQKHVIAQAAREHDSPGSAADYAYVEEDLREKLNRATFARDMQSVDNATYGNLETINNTHL